MSTEVNTDQPLTETTEKEVDPMVRQLSIMAELLETLAKTSKSLTTEMKVLTKDVNKLRSLKTGKKSTKRAVDPDAPKKIGSLEKPVPISDELATFLGINVGEEYSRQYITRCINTFVKENNLQNPENRRYILLESEAGLKLKALLRDPDQPLTFFNIQRYLRPHYPKPEDSSSESKGKSVDVSDTPVKQELQTETAVVPDSAVVQDETPSEPPKKKVVKRVVKKVPVTA